MSILEDFYTEKIRPFDLKIDPNSKHCQISNAYEDIFVELKNSLPEDNRKLLLKMFDCGLDLSYENGKANYIAGFITGMRFAAECFYEKK